MQPEPESLMVASTELPLLANSGATVGEQFHFEKGSLQELMNEGRTVQ
jgi:hypothetical protein